MVEIKYYLTDSVVMGWIGYKYMAFETVGAYLEYVRGV